MTNNANDAQAPEAQVTITGRNVEVPCTPVTGSAEGGSSIGADWLPGMDVIVNPIAEGSSKF